MSLDGTVPNLGRVKLNFSASSPQELAQKVEDAIETQLGGEYVTGGDQHIDVLATTSADGKKTRLIFRTSTVAGDKAVASVDDEGKISGTPILRVSEVATREGDETFRPTFFSGTSQATGTLSDDRLKILVDGETVFADVGRGDYLIPIATSIAAADTGNTSTLTISPDDAAKVGKGDIIEIRQGITTGTAQIVHIDTSTAGATLYLDKTISKANFSDGLQEGTSYIRVVSSNYKLGNLFDVNDNGTVDSGEEVTVMKDTDDALGGTPANLTSADDVSITSANAASKLSAGDRVIIGGQVIVKTDTGNVLRKFTNVLTVKEVDTGTGQVTFDKAIIPSGIIDASANESYVDMDATLGESQVNLLRIVPNALEVSAENIGKYLDVGDQVSLGGTVDLDGADDVTLTATLTITSMTAPDANGKVTITFDKPILDPQTVGQSDIIDDIVGQHTYTSTTLTSMKIINGGKLARDIEKSINGATLYAEDVSVGIDDSRDVVITSGISGIQSYLEIKGGSLDATEQIPLFQELGFNYLQNDKGQGSDFSFQLGGAKDVFRISIDLVSPTSLGADGVDISDIDVSSQAGANKAVEKLEKAIQSIGTTSTKVGAAISAIRRRQDVLETHRENLIEQRARLQEVDFAQETQRFTQLQILLQSATAVLAQANVVPTTLLQLLG